MLQRLGKGMRSTDAVPGLIVMIAKVFLCSLERSSEEGPRTRTIPRIFNGKSLLELNFAILWRVSWRRQAV